MTFSGVENNPDFTLIPENNESIMYMIFSQENVSVHQVF